MAESASPTRQLPAQLETPLYAPLGSDPVVRHTVRKGTPGWLAKCLARRDQEGKFAGKAILPTCSDEYLLLEDIDGDGVDEIVAHLPWEMLAPTVGLETLSGTLLVTFQQGNSPMETMQPGHMKVSTGLVGNGFPGAVRSPSCRIVFSGGP